MIVPKLLEAFTQKFQGIIDEDTEKYYPLEFFFRPLHLKGDFTPLEPI